VTVGYSDVRRARERADRLARVVPTPAPTVAGCAGCPGRRRAAVTNAHAVASGEEDLDE